MNSVFLHIREYLHLASEPVTVILAIVAMLFAAIQKWESTKLLRSSSDLKNEADALEKNTKSHAEEMKTLTGEMRAIANAMSTKYVGGFPKNMGDICEVVGMADRSLDIQVDLLAYGHYSNPDAFNRYIDKIEDFVSRNPQAIIRVLVYADHAAEKGRSGQFGGPEGFAEEMKSERFRRCFTELYNSETPSTYDQFMKYLADRQVECRKRLECYRAIKIRYASFPFRLFLWVEDQEEAVFAFEMYGQNRTISFRTRDGNLIHTFGTMFEQNWQDCAPKPALQELEKKPVQSVSMAS
jgi:hypothetical protein